MEEGHLKILYGMMWISKTERNKACSNIAHFTWSLHEIFDITTSTNLYVSSTLHYSMNTKASVYWHLTVSEKRFTVEG